MKGSATHISELCLYGSPKHGHWKPGENILNRRKEVRPVRPMPTRWNLASPYWLWWWPRNIVKGGLEEEPTEDFPQDPCKTQRESSNTKRQHSRNLGQLRGLCLCIKERRDPVVSGAYKSILVLEPMVGNCICQLNVRNSARVVVGKRIGSYPLRLCSTAVLQPTSTKSPRYSTLASRAVLRNVQLREGRTINILREAKPCKRIAVLVLDRR